MVLEQKRNVEADETEPAEVALGLKDEEIRRLEQLLEKEKKITSEYMTKLKYLQADFDNYRKRVDNETREKEDFATSALIRKLLPIVDELELAVASAEKTEGNKSILEGVRMVLKKLNLILEDEGVTRIQALGRPFNPNLHEAAEKVQGENEENNQVIQEIRSGYLLKGKMLRPSMVKVAVAKKHSNESEDNAKEASSA
jgi:molecular chaperone GrpE